MPNSCKIYNMKSIQEIILEDTLELVKRRKQEEERKVAAILRSKFWIDVNDIESVKKIIYSKKLAVIYSYNGELLGISSNNRWLYTIDGETIGRKGNKFMIEKIKAAK